MAWQRMPSLLAGNAEFQDVHDSRFHPPAMRDLRIYGKNRLSGLFRAWLKKQIGVKARAGRSSTCWLTSKFEERKVTLNGEL